MALSFVTSSYQLYRRAMKQSAICMSSNILTVRVWPRYFDPVTQFQPNVTQSKINFLLDKNLQTNLMSKIYFHTFEIFL